MLPLTLLTFILKALVLIYFLAGTDGIGGDSRVWSLIAEFSICGLLDGIVFAASGFGRVRLTFDWFIRYGALAAASNILNLWASLFVPELAVWTMLHASCFVFLIVRMRKVTRPTRKEVINFRWILLEAIARGLAERYAWLRSIW